MKHTIRKILKEYLDPKHHEVFVDGYGNYNPDKEIYINTVLDKLKKETVFHNDDTKVNYDGHKIEFTTPWGKDGFYGTYEDMHDDLIIGDRGTEMPVKWSDMYGLSELERNWVSMVYRKWVNGILRSRRVR